MIIIGILSMLLGVYCCYNSSKKALLIKGNFIEIYLQQHTLISKIVGFLLLFFSFTILVIELGAVSGFFAALVLLMTLSCLLILVMPLRN